MRAFTPEISWHNRLPALSLDISRPLDDAGNVYRLATGGNDCRVYVWLIDLSKTSSTLTSSLVSTDNGNNKASPPDVKIRAGLRRHQKSVGAVRFSQQFLLASGDDDGYIYIWKNKSDEERQNNNDIIHPHLQPLQPQVETNVFLNDDGFEDLDVWQQQRVLRGHVEDICDLAWSKDGQHLLSGSVDNSAILWDVTKGTKIWCSDLIKGYVQGVAIDPHSQYLVAFSSDRTLRVYNYTDKRLLHATRRMNIKGGYKSFFCDDTVQTFCRRLEFSPDGQFLIAPTSRIIEKELKPVAPKTQTPPPASGDPASNGNAAADVIELTDSPDKPIEKQMKSDNGGPEEQPSEELKEKPMIVDIDLVDEEKNENSTNGGEKQQVTDPKDNNAQPSAAKTISKKPSKPFNVFLVFKRNSFSKPVHYYPTGREVALCCRFSPVIYKLRDNPTNFWDIPYRIVFAIATARSIIIYDSQQATPIGYASQIHLARLTDLAWSRDGRLLMVSSYDGYSTMITFDQNEFGEPYDGPLFEPMAAKAAVEEQIKVDEQANGENGEEVVVKPLKKGQKRAKGPKEASNKKEKLNPEPEVKPSNGNSDKNGGDKTVDDEQQNDSTSTPNRTPKKSTPQKITPTRVPESATIWRFLVPKKKPTPVTTTNTITDTTISTTNNTTTITTTTESEPEIVAMLPQSND